MRFTCLPAASAQSVRFWNVPDRVGPNNKCDENEALGVGYLVPKVTQLSKRVQSRVSWFHSTAKSGRLLGRTEPATRSCGRGLPGTQAWRGLSGGCVSQGGTGAGHAGRSSKEVLQPERPRPCSESEKPLCSGHRPRLPGTCGPRTPGATAHSGSARRVSLRRRRRRVTLSQAAAAPSCGLLRSRGLLGLFIE